MGLQAARGLVALGDDVTILGRSGEKGERALDELSAGPGRARFVQADLSTHGGVRSAATKLLGRLVLNSVEESASNVVTAETDAGWSGAVYWPKPGNFGVQVPIGLDPVVTAEMVRRSAALVGV
nr:hypothetical protein [Psychromicrobium sp. YIM S02556]